MKKITVLFLTIFTVIGLYSQSYEIDFAGTGANTVVDSVKVENLKQGISLTLNGNDVLKLNIVTGIFINAYDINLLQVYPNPMTDHAEIQFFVNKSSNVLVAVYDISGRSVIQSDMFLHPGMHKFRVSGLHQGMYTVRINEQNSFYTAKLISQNRLNGEAEIDYVSSKNTQLNKTKTKQLKSTTSTIDMTYENGDRLKFTGMSDNYSTIITDVPSGNNTITFDFMDCTDADDNHYPVVKISTQVWMAANLKTTKYNDGTAIPMVTVDTAWGNLTTPGYCWYGNDQATYGDTYGALYNWFSVDTVILCPTGWHAPTDAEWTMLTDYLGGQNLAGGKLKETGTTHWNSPNTGATNETGFTALPGGSRYSYGPFSSVGSYVSWWSATENGTNNAWYRLIYYDFSDVSRHDYGKQYGLSVRCLRD